MQYGNLFLSGTRSCLYGYIDIAIIVADSSVLLVGYIQFHPCYLMPNLPQKTGELTGTLANIKLLVQAETLLFAKGITHRQVRSINKRLACFGVKGCRSIMCPLHWQPLKLIGDDLFFLHYCGLVDCFCASLDSRSLVKVSQLPKYHTRHIGVSPSEMLSSAVTSSMNADSIFATCNKNCLSFMEEGLITKAI